MRSSEEIKKRIERSEKKLGRELTKNERRKIEKKVIRKHRRENFIRGLFLAAGVFLGASGVKALDSGKNIEKQHNQQTQEAIINSKENISQNEKYVKDNKSQEDKFRDSLIVDKDELNKKTKEEEIDYEKIEQKIIDEYNQEYNDNLTKEETSIIQSTPQFVGIDKNNNYIQDYKQETPVVQYKTNGIGNIYVAIDNRDEKIIYSVGKIEGKIVNVDTKVVQTYNDGKRKEYFESNNNLDITKNKDEKEVNNIYDTLEHEFEEQQKQKEQQENEINRD